MPLPLSPLALVALTALAQPELDALPEALVEPEDRARVDQLLVEPFVSIDRLVALEDELDARAALLAPRSRGRAITLSFSVVSEVRTDPEVLGRGVGIFATLTVAFDALLDPRVDLRPSPGAERERLERCAALFVAPSAAPTIELRRRASRASALGCEGGS